MYRHSNCALHNTLTQPSSVARGGCDSGALVGGGCVFDGLRGKTLYLAVSTGSPSCRVTLVSYSGPPPPPVAESEFGGAGPGTGAGVGAGAGAGAVVVAAAAASVRPGAADGAGAGAGAGAGSASSTAVAVAAPQATLGALLGIQAELGPGFCRCPVPPPPPPCHHPESERSALLRWLLAVRSRLLARLPARLPARLRPGTLAPPADQWDKSRCSNAGALVQASDPAVMHGSSNGCPYLRWAVRLVAPRHSY
jgi:hypothetical protein